MHNMRNLFLGYELIWTGNKRLNQDNSEDSD